MVYVKTLGGVYAIPRDTENAATVVAGWGRPPPFLQHLTQGQNPDPSSCSCASRQGAHMAWRSWPRSQPRNISRISRASQPAEHTLQVTYFHVRLKAVTYKLNSQKGRSELIERHLPTTRWSCSAWRSSKTSAKAAEHPAPSFQLWI